MSIEKQISDERRNIRKEVLIRHVLHALRDTVQLRGVSVDTTTDDVMVEMTDASARLIAPLVEAVDILEEIIWASDGCQGHAACQHSMEPWQRARALLKPKWEAYEYRTQWPTADPIGSGTPSLSEASGESAQERSEREKNLAITTLTDRERSAINELTVMEPRTPGNLEKWGAEMDRSLDAHDQSRSDQPQQSISGPDQRGDDSGS